MSMDPAGTNVTIPDPLVVKPGYRTSEWWTAIGTSVVSFILGICALFGISLSSDKLTPLIGALAVIGPAISSAWYSHSRGMVKAAAIHASAARTAGIPLATVISGSVQPDVVVAPDIVAPEPPADSLGEQVAT